jgi:pyrroline-5-carboxylate reductase
MGKALIRGLIASGIASGEQILISSKSASSAQKAAGDLGAGAASTNADAVREADVVFLCVKPSQALEVIGEVAPHLTGKLLISVVTGIRAVALLKASGGNARIIRTMPNTAVRLRKGVTAIAPDGSSTGDDLKTALSLFTSVGTAVEVREEELDAVTAVSGSGPAFALLMLEALSQGGIEEGLSAGTARTLAAGALAAAASLVLENGESPEDLRAEITSPGGTTAAGLSVLAEAGFPSTVAGAVSAARRRATELSS